MKPLLSNPNTPEAVLNILFNDLINRSNAVKLRAFLALAKVPDHPLRDEALANLHLYLGGDYGTDWVGWNSAIQRHNGSSAAQ